MQMIRWVRPDGSFFWTSGSVPIEGSIIETEVWEGLHSHRLKEELKTELKQVEPVERWKVTRVQTRLTRGCYTSSSYTVILEAAPANTP